MFVWKEIPQILEEGLWLSSTQVQIHWGSWTPFSWLWPSVTRSELQSSALLTKASVEHWHCLPRATVTHWLQPMRAGCQNAPSPWALRRHKEIRLWHAPKLHQTGYFTASIWSTHGSKELSDRREKRLTISAGLRGWEERLSLFTVSYTRSVWLSAALTSSSASTREVLDWWEALQEQGTSQKSPVMKESSTGDGEQSSWGLVTLGDTQMMKWQHWPQALCELFALKPTPLKRTVLNDFPSEHFRTTIVRKYQL